MNDSEYATASEGGNAADGDTPTPAPTHTPSRDIQIEAFPFADVHFPNLSPNAEPTSNLPSLDPSSHASAESSTNVSRPPSSGEQPPAKHRGRVRFNSTSEANDTTNKRTSFPLHDKSSASEPFSAAALANALSPPKSAILPRNGSSTDLPRRTSDDRDVLHSEPLMSLGLKRPVLRKGPASTSPEAEDLEADDDESKIFSALAAQERALRVASLVGSHSAPGSRRNSLNDVDELDEDSPTLLPSSGFPVRFDDIPLVEVDRKKLERVSANNRGYNAAAQESDDDEPRKGHNEGNTKTSNTSEAHKLVRAHTRKGLEAWISGPKATPSAMGLQSGQVTPIEEQDAENYVAPPQQYRGGVLSSLLKLYNAQPAGHHPHGYASHSRTGSDISNSPSGGWTPASSGSGTTTPRSKHAKWYNSRNQSTDTLSNLIGASAMLAAHGGAGAGSSGKPHRPGMGKRTSSASKLLDTAKGRMSGRPVPGRPRLEDEIRITIHIAETLSRQKYLLKLCRALMSYGAPTHRLEEYMKMSARVLEIDGQFLYLPGCMIISFDDSSTHTTEVKLVRTNQGINLGKLKDVHEIYKEVVHDVIGVEEATQRLDELIQAPPKHSPWMLLIVYGLASASVAPFAFQARLIDLPIAFILGCCLGFLQLILAPKSELYSNVFEISAAVLTSFLARAFGSIRGGDLFCFSGLAQASIALILPGYLVLCGSLELQSRSIVAGSVRMVYAIIYSLFLGFGITIGTAIYGLIDANATSETTCTNPLPSHYRWFFVPAFSLCLAVINQAKWKQIPVMLTISFIGYIVNYYSALKFPSSAQISNTLGALVIGVLGNLYSRMHHGVAAAAILPAIFVQVPSGIAASGSLLSGLSAADVINNASVTLANGTIVNATAATGGLADSDFNSIVFNVGFSMIQVAIGITVGLFLSAIIVYPFGKRRSGLFSF